MFAQWQNRLTTHFSERIPVIKWRMTVQRTHSLLEYLKGSVTLHKQWLDKKVDESSLDFYVDLKKQPWKSVCPAVTPGELQGWYCWIWVQCSYSKLCDVFVEVHKYWQILGLSHKVFNKAKNVFNKIYRNSCNWLLCHMRWEHDCKLSVVQISDWDGACPFEGTISELT